MKVKCVLNCIKISVLWIRSFWVPDSQGAELTVLSKKPQE